jgi:hypothetical protein
MTVPNVWIDENHEGGFKVPSGKGERLIVSHMGSSACGFLPEAKLIFKETSKDADYHGNFNSAIFLKWLKEKCFPYMKAGDVLVLDQAPYHRTLTKDSQPAKLSQTKAQLANWIIDHSPSTPFVSSSLSNDQMDTLASHLNLLSLSKAELILKCKEMKPSPTYESVELGKAFGVDVIFLPVAHPELNPIELMWARVKGTIRRNNSDFTMKSLETISNSAIAEITTQDWVRAEAHCITYEKMYTAQSEHDEIEFSAEDPPEFDEDVNIDT